MDPVAHVTELVLATGALGTAAFGIVEGLKPVRWVGEAGFEAIPATLGDAVQTLEQAHGPGWEAVYRGLYRGDQAELARLLRQGARIGLTRENAAAVGAALFGARAPEIADLVRVTTHLYAAAAEQGGGEARTTDAERRALGRFELAMDARIDAALAIARQRYASRARLSAFVVSLGVALGTAVMLDEVPGGGWSRWLVALLVGVAAVPIAPIAKDVASGIQAAAKALRAR